MSLKPMLWKSTALCSKTTNIKRNTILIVQKREHAIPMVQSYALSCRHRGYNNRLKREKTSFCLGLVTERLAV